MKGGDLAGIRDIGSDLYRRLGLADLSTRQFPPDVANRYRRGQIRGTIEQMRLLLLGNTIFAPILALQVWPSGAHVAVLIWTIANVLCSWWLFFVWSKLYESDGTAQDMRRFEMHTAINALTWLIGFALFYSIVQAEQKTVFTTIMAGALALGTFGYSRAPIPGLIYLTTLACGNGLVALVNGLMTGSVTDYIISGLSFVAAITLANAVIERGRASVIAFRTHEQLIEKKEVIELLLHDYERQAIEWLWQTDDRGHLTAAPQPILDLLGVTRDTMADGPLFPIVRSKCTPECADDLSRLADCLRNLSDFHGIKLSMRDTLTGELRWLDVKGRAQFEAGTYKGFRGILTDATAMVEAQRQVTYLATYDSLTDLLNRNSVQNLLRKLDVQTDHAAAFLIDLDGFKQINDSYGHHIGDALLRGAAERLRALGTDNTFPARLAGDEFFLLSKQPGLTQQDAQTIGQEICDRLSEPFQIDDYELTISASVGVARFPMDTKAGLDLLSLSDLALYDAKAGGRNQARLYDKAMLDKLNKRIAVIERLKNAVRNGHIRPHYQSQHRLSDGALVGFEALARWIDDELGFVGPDIFIPIAEQTGLIVELGEQLMRMACADAARWADQLQDAAPVISINISPVQFARTDVAQTLAGILAATRLPAHLVEVEVTEGVLISDKTRVAATLGELSAMGVSIALDDFGTGYSSLSYLKDLPLNRLKIDRSFVNDLEVGPDSPPDGTPDSPIVSTVIQLGHNLGFNVIAEGVETAAQAAHLHALGCDDAQGYHYSRPVPVAEADKIVQAAAHTAFARKRVG